MGDAHAAFHWLHDRGYINGEKSPLASKSNSCLRLFGGNMPPAQAVRAGTMNAQTAADLSAWVAAGAHDD